VDRYGVKFPYAFSFRFLVHSFGRHGVCIFDCAVDDIANAVGAAESLVAPASVRWIRYNFVERERGLAVAGTKIGPAVAAPLAAWLAMFYRLRLMFSLIGLGGAVWLVPG
jgi:MFS transporter, ACS family, D-galactonate transporter